MMFPHVVKNLLRLIASVASVLLLATGIFGCSQEIRKNNTPSVSFQTKPWSEASFQTTTHYDIRANTDAEVTRHIGNFMEMALTAYRAVLEDEKSTLPRLRICVYATKKDYEAVAGRLGLPPGITTGLYTPIPPASIHLPYIRNRKIDPERTLLHEGLHQFIDQTTRFHLPENARNHFSKSRLTLTSVPLWLNEGLAAYMEGTLAHENRLEIGRVNQERLVYLQKLLRRGKCPPIKRVLSLHYGQPVSAADYAVAWGLVFALRHWTVGIKGTDPHAKLMHYIAASRQGFYQNPDVQFTREFVRGGKSVDNFDHTWSVQLARRAFDSFVAIFLNEGLTMKYWEQDWRAFINKLDSRDPYGGLPQTDVLVIE